MSAVSDYNRPGPCLGPTNTGRHPRDYPSAGLPAGLGVMIAIGLIVTGILFISSNNLIQGMSSAHHTLTGGFVLALGMASLASSAIRMENS